MHTSKCITSNKLLSCSILLKMRLFSHLAHMVWFACLKWSKIKWVQTIHLHGVSSCVYTNRHGSRVSNFSKTSKSKDPSTRSFFMHFIPIWLKWQCHKQVVLSLLSYIFWHENVYPYDQDSINHSFRCKSTYSGLILILMVEGACDVWSHQTWKHFQHISSAHL